MNQPLQRRVSRRAFLSVVGLLLTLNATVYGLSGYECVPLVRVLVAVARVFVPLLFVAITRRKLGSMESDLGSSAGLLLLLRKARSRRDGCVPGATERHPLLPPLRAVSFYSRFFKS